jgi:phospho-N-acetylmuramoyl-pentapeptide-transferase
MIYHLLDYLHGRQIAYIYVNPFQYTTFRAAVTLATALMISLVIGPRVIAVLRALKAGQPIRTVTVKGAPDLAEMHGKKAGTPTMGGVLIVISMLVPVFLFCDLLNPLVWLLILVTFGFATLGFLDDYLKITKKNADGLSARNKIIGQVLLGLFVGTYLYFFGHTEILNVKYSWREAGVPQIGPYRGYEYIMVPFIKWLYPYIGGFFVLYAVVVLTASSNAVNLTDGLDGLCIGITTIVAITFMVFTYVGCSEALANRLMLPHVPRADEVVVFLGALTGACLGFLWYNAYPAEMFMGDTGSLTLGGVIGTVALIAKQEVLLIIVGGIFVLEALSVIIQVLWFKLTKRRVFLMAPLHHHYERKGMMESKIIARFWIVSGLLALMGLSSLKLR